MPPEQLVESILQKEQRIAEIMADIKELLAKQCMSTKWPNVKLGDVMGRSAETIELQPDAVYRQITVKLWGKGAVLRGVLTGAEVAAPRQMVARQNQFILSRIDARNGALGIVPAELDGAVVSNDFPVFNLAADRMLPAYLGWMCKTAAFIEECRRASEGTTNRVRLQADKFLAREIPLPPLSEQRRIVARIEELGARVEEARELRVQIENETNVFFAKVLARAFEPYRSSMRPIGDVFNVTTGGTPSRGNPAFWGGDIKWVSSGEVRFRSIEDTTEKITRDGVEGSNAKVNPPGTVLLAMIGQGKTRGQCAVLKCHAANNQNVAAIHVYRTPHSPEYVYWWLYSQYQQSRAVETGTAQPALSGERVKRIEIPLPNCEEQRRIVAYLHDFQAKVKTLDGLQSDTSTELDALMPSILDKAFRGEM